MDWNTLLSVFLGGILATIPIILSNGFQAKEMEKDRQEQTREAKIQSREKWIERDILEIIESIDIVLNELALGTSIMKQADMTDRLILKRTRSL
jgi:hypothetical protein